ncbi:ferric-chelate reductase [Phaeosphaeria sp. MPI-PUGE-AT-0046c]|nr:ferric-chelate reductase [Phaeosphaeria sp. MPI-PUGE-AT-0046c]
MSHSGHMSMGSATLPPLYDFPKIYWAVVGSAIGVATLVNVYNHALYRQRLSAARSGVQNPAKPRSWFALFMATTFALVREISSFTLRIPLKSHTIQLPSVGRASLVLANAATLIVLCLYGLDLQGRFTKEDVAFRCGVVTLGQLPLIFLLAGRNNVIGYLSGVSYERLNWLHRWCARCMLLTATIHMGYFFSSWDRYDFIPYKLKNDQISWKGLVAWSVLVWIVFSSMTPIRGWNYEIFVVQHLMSFAVFVGFVYIHIPADTKGYVWVPVALFFFDRLIRGFRVLYANLSIFHAKQRQQGQERSLLTCKAEFTPLPHNTTRVVIKNPPITWTPGQHVFLSCHSVVPLQTHPFTIASIPEDGTMEFLIKSEKGGTRRFFRHAEKVHGQADRTSSNKTVTIEGPYGCLRPLRQFDSIVFLAGSTGATFTLPLLRDIIQGWRENTGVGATKRSLPFLGRSPGAVTRHARFVWVVKSRRQLGWFSEQLSSVFTEFEVLQEKLRDIKLELTVYITCDESFTEERHTLLSNLTAPTHSTSSGKASEHGKIQYADGSGYEADWNRAEKDETRVLTSAGTNNTDDAQNVRCCCRAEVDDSAPDRISKECCCSKTPKEVSTTQRRNAPTSITSSSSGSPSSLKSSQPIQPQDELRLHPSVTIYAGRPKTREIIRRSLEQALGESAVVVCGPHGLVADVKQDVCSLSDERAVHKGTGAQGIYLHTESFSY